MMIREHVPLAPLTTFGIGGLARYFCRVASLVDLTEALSFSKKRELPVFLLGGGSNVLVADEGFPGLVIKNEIQGVSFTERKGEVFVTAGAGEMWDGLVAQSVERGLWGIENLSGIPGTVGGAAVQNIGAYGQALSETIQHVVVFDIKEGRERECVVDQLQFGYRDSIFKREEGRYVVLSVTLRLCPDSAPALGYKDLAEYFLGKDPSLSDIRSAVLSIRERKFPDITKEGTAGSFFKNPVLSEEEAQALQKRFQGLPLFSLPETSGKKVPLAWFLDSRNGAFALGDFHTTHVRLFERQPLVVVASRHARASDVYELMRRVQKEIQTMTSVSIEPEVTLVGFSS